MTDKTEAIERLLGGRFIIADLLPERVPRDSSGDRFAAERYFLNGERGVKLFESFAELLIKLGCYFDITAADGDGITIEHDGISGLRDAVMECADGRTRRNFLIDGEKALIVTDGDCAYLSMYFTEESERAARLFGVLAEAAGLFIREPAREVHLREADSAEKAEFLRLITAHFADTLAENGVFSESWSYSGAEGILAEIGADKQSEHYYMAADADCGTAGFIWYRTSEDTVKYAYTVYLYINEELRGRGFGESILRELEKRAAEQGICELRLCVWKSNPAAMRLYGRLGYRVYDDGDRKMYMKKQLKRI